MHGASVMATKELPLFRLSHKQHQYLETMPLPLLSVESPALLACSCKKQNLTCFGSRKPRWQPPQEPGRDSSIGGKFSHEKLTLGHSIEATKNGFVAPNSTYSCSVWRQYWTIGLIIFKHFYDSTTKSQCFCRYNCQKCYCLCIVSWTKSQLKAVI